MHKISSCVVQHNIGQCTPRKLLKLRRDHLAELMLYGLRLAHNLMNKLKINQADLNVSDFLLLKEGHCLRDQTLSICKTSENEWVEKNNKVVFESGNLETLIKLVEQKFGMTLLPSLATKYIKERKLKNQLKEFSDPVPKREIGFIYSKTFIKKHFLNAIREEILKVIPEEFKQNKKGLVIH